MNCKICGKPSGFYPLCVACNKLKDDGSIIKCEVCDTWHNVDEPCKCKPIKSAKKKIVPVIDEQESVCIICQQPSNGYWFCKSCYAKYSNHSVDLRITNCKEVEILDDYGNKKIKCADGHHVRSRAEALISDFFFREKIRSVYEKPVYYKKDNGEQASLIPDFYLPDYNLYIEYNELTSKKYLKSKEYSKSIFDKLNIKVLIVTEKELADLEAFLKPELGLH